MVQTAAEPSLKKSTPEQNINAFHGFAYGTVIVSTAKPSAGNPARPTFVIAGNQCTGPALESSARFSVAEDATTALLKSANFSLSPDHRNSFACTVSVRG